MTEYPRYPIRRIGNRAIAPPFMLGMAEQEGKVKMNPRQMTEIIDRKRYDTEKATLITGDDYWDGHNWERSGRNTFLFRTAKGSYFAQHLTCWQGEKDRIEPLSIDEATELWESLSERRVEYEEAFPGIEVEDA